MTTYPATIDDLATALPAARGRTHVTVSLVAFTANLRRLRDLAGPATVLPVVKSDAYGHGLGPVVRAGLRAGVGTFGVAFVEEGLDLRRGLRPTDSVRVLVCTEPAKGEEDDTVAADLTSTVYTRAGIDRLAAAARRLGRETEVQLKIDTGLHRLGASPDEAADLVLHIRSSGLRLGGVWTHFATADDPDGAFRDRQLELFTESVRRIERAGVQAPCRHTANSAAALATSRTHLDAVRIGALLYGIRPAAAIPGADHFDPVLSWRSRVAMARRCARDERVSYGHKYRLDQDSVVATVPVGYGDGLPRLLGNRGEVLIGGRRRRIAGAVGMSHIVVDCGTDQVSEGDEVVLVGRQGDEEVSAEELAQRSGSTAYEVLTRISPRVPRVHHGGAAVDPVR